MDYWNNDDVIKDGDMVYWSYIHRFGKAKVRHTKQGIFIGLVDHTEKYWRRYGAQQMAKVMFKNNRSVSRVPLDDLRICGA